MMLPPFPAPPPPLERRPHVSIVVNNHNYEEFLERAIHSALEQSDVDLEVIVVDDGSTDGSRAVIDRFGERVKPIFQARLGQKGAFNSGLRAATGEVVMFLDADDELSPGIVVAVADAFAAHPEAGRVVFRLEIVDRWGHPTGAILPPADVPLPEGDVRAAALSHPDDLAWPPTSGNAFAAWMLTRIMPLRLDGDAKGGDFLLHAMTPLLAPVVALPRTGGRYRIHGRNALIREQVDVAYSRRLVVRAQETHAAIRHLAQDLGYPTGELRSVTLAAHRILSLRGRDEHPIPDDNLRAAVSSGLRAAVQREDATPSRKALFILWLLVLAVAPWPLARAAAGAVLSPTRRGRGPVPGPR